MRPTREEGGTGKGSPKSRYINRVLVFNAGPLFPGVGHVKRARFTIAEVNAGAEILPAIPGYKYRMQDASLCAVGGAAGAVTTVDILGTRSAGAVKLLAGAQANLTENTLIRAGATGGAVLAAGASFTALDANTAVTIGKTGADVTTATHVDALITYTIEAA